VFIIGSGDLRVLCGCQQCYSVELFVTVIGSNVVRNILIKSCNCA